MCTFLKYINNSRQITGMVILLSAFVLLSCEKDEGAPVPVPEPVNLQITIPAGSHWVTDELQLGVQFNGKSDTTRSVNWSTSNDTIATIDDSGKVLLKKEGEVTITAQYDKFSDNKTLQVLPMRVMYQTVGQNVNAIRSINWSDLESFDVLTGTWEYSTPRMAPNKRALVYADTIDRYNPDIFVYDFTKSKRIRIAGHERWDDQPSWDVSSEKIFFRSFRDNGLGSIFSYNLADSTVVNLTPNPSPAVFANLDPAISPDGSHLAMSSNFSGGHDIWLYNLSTKSRTPAYETDVYEGEPAWSPDGAKLVFRANFEDGSDLVILNVETKTTKRLRIIGTERQPVWSPNGKFIVFAHEVENNPPYISYVNPENMEAKTLGIHLGYSPSFY